VVTVLTYDFEGDRIWPIIILYISSSSSFCGNSGFRIQSLSFARQVL
jgi:hypothetical protein